MTQVSWVIQFIDHKGGRDRGVRKPARNQRGYNCDVHRPAKLTRAQVLEIRHQHEYHRKTYAELAAEHGVTKGAIAAVCEYVNWSHVLPEGMRRPKGTP